MACEFDLNKANRLKLSRRVSHIISAATIPLVEVIEGQMGESLWDDLTHPDVLPDHDVDHFGILRRITTALAVFGWMQATPSHTIWLMPSPPDWVDLAKEILTEGLLQPFTRYTFSASSLSSEHLA